MNEAAYNAAFTPPDPVTAIATIRVNPLNEQAVRLFAEEAQRLQHYSTERVILSDDDVKLATEDLNCLSKLKKAIEEKRKEYVTPINDHLKAVNDAFKTITAPLDSADQVTRSKILTWRHAQEEKKRQIDEANRLRMEAARLEAQASGTGEISESVVILPSPAAPPKTIFTDTGSAGVSKIWKFEVTDFDSLPTEYKMVDAVKLGRVVRAGLHEIPGVRTWPEDNLRITGGTR